MEGSIFMNFVGIDITNKPCWTYGGHLLVGEKAQLPVFSKNGNTACLTYSSRDGKGRSFGRYADVETLFPLRLGNSRDIIEHGEPGSFDVAGAMPMQVVDNFLFYIGWTLRLDVPYFNYLSVSYFDGQEVNKIGPILAPDIHETGYSGTFHVQKIKDRYLGYYLSVVEWLEDEHGQLNPCYDIKIAASNDLLNWKRMGKTAIPRFEGEAGISAFTVIQHKDRYHAWFSARKGKEFRASSDGGYRICHASSNDGLNWVRDKKFQINPGDFLGCEHMAAYPSVFVYEQKVVMVFNGNGFGDDGVHWCYMELSELEGEG